MELKYLKKTSFTSETNFLNDFVTASVKYNRNGLLYINGCKTFLKNKGYISVMDFTNYVN